MSPIKATGLVGLATRLIDKSARLFNLSRNRADTRVHDESVADTLADIANYGLIGQMLNDGVFDAWQNE